MDDGDDEFVRRAAAGERRAWELLLLKHGPRIRRTVGAILRDREEADDAAQQAWLHALGALGTFEGVSSFSTWMKRIAVNEALGRIRERVRHPVAPAAEADEEDHGLDPERQATAREGLALLRAAMAGLPAASLRVFALREVDGRSVRETARETGLSVAAVKTRLLRARRALRAALEGGAAGRSRGARPRRM